MRKQEFISQGTVTIPVGGTPVLGCLTENRPVRHLMTAVNFLRCGCTCVQIVWTQVRRDEKGAGRGDANIEVELFMKDMRPLQLPGEDFFGSVTAFNENSGAVVLMVTRCFQRPKTDRKKK